ncbi:proline-rich protein 36-like [Phacochoerus africanus]|uniref:proline-rich protein 36-like n=1 Tax=Phacochoerus africanus TaxID=41426 RepID=UPI001FDA7F27|nr:proline-rich protein 36-like [Phacochoerus africanus]
MPALAPLWLRLPPQPAGGAPSPSGASRRPCRSASSAASLFPASRPGGPPRPAELLTRLLSRCPQLRSGRCSLGAPPPRFLPRQLCPDRAAALDRTPFLPSFILSGNSHSSSACDVPRTRPLRPSECGPPGSSQKPLPSSPRPGLSSLMSCFTQRQGPWQVLQWDQMYEGVDLKNMHNLKALLNLCTNQRRIEWSSNSHHSPAVLSVSSGIRQMLVEMRALSSSSFPITAGWKDRASDPVNLSWLTLIQNHLTYESTLPRREWGLGCGVRRT